MTIPTAEKDKKMENLLELNRSILHGTAGGKVIWQPRILCWLADKKYLNQPLPGNLDGLTNDGIYRNLGCSNRIYEYNSCFRKVLPENVQIARRQTDLLEWEETTWTPIGKLTSIIRGNTSNPGCYKSKWPVTTENDLKVMMWITERTDWAWDQAKYDELNIKWGDIGLPTMYIGPRVTVQNLFHDIMGVEAGIYAVMDYPATVEKYFTALNECTLRLIDVINASPIEWVNYGDNLHGGVLPPEWFEKYVLPAYLQRSEKLHSAGKFVHSHWDGDCKSLLPYARFCGLDGIEAITPKPQGDVTLEEVKAALGDEVFLIDGIAALLFQPRYPVHELEVQVKKVIELFAPKLILGISDEMPSDGDIERVRLVGEMVNEYNRHLDA
jgi:hypothetical protein